MESGSEQLDAELEELEVDAGEDDQREEIYYWREKLEQWLDGILVQVLLDELAKICVVLVNSFPSLLY